jgi:ribose transport system substrate-binding protein
MKVRLRGVALLLGAAALVASVVLVFVGTASGARSASKLSIAVFYYNPSPYGIAQLKGAQRGAKALGVNVTGFNPNNDPKLQQTQMRDAITTGKYQGMLVAALDGHGLYPTIKQAIAKGVKVATVDYTLGLPQQQVNLVATPGLVTTVGQPIGNEWKGLITTIKKACAVKVGAGKPCNVAFLPGLSNYPTDVIRVNAMKKAFSSGPIKFTLMPPGMYDQATSQKVTLDFFQAKPDVDVLATFGDQQAVGAEVAFKQLGIKPAKDLLIIGYGASKEGVARVKSGQWYATLGLYPAGEMEVALKYVVDAIKSGKKAPNPVDVMKTPGHPLIVDKAYLAKNPGFKADWGLSG